MILDFLPQLLVLVVVGGEFLDKPGVFFCVLVRGVGFFSGLFNGLFLHGLLGCLGRFVRAGFLYGFDCFVFSGVPGSPGRFVCAGFLGGFGRLVLFGFLIGAGVCGGLPGSLRLFGFGKGNGVQISPATGTGFGIFLDKRTAFRATGWHRSLVLSANLDINHDLYAGGIRKNQAPLSLWRGRSRGASLQIEV